MLPEAIRRITRRLARKEPQEVRIQSSVTTVLTSARATDCLGA